MKSWMEVYVTQTSYNDTLSETENERWKIERVFVTIIAALYTGDDRVIAATGWIILNLTNFKVV